MSKVRYLAIIAFIIIGLMSQASLAENALDLGVAGIGARPLGMGKAFVAIADDANAVFTNPAGLGTQKSWALTSMSTQLFGKASYTLAAQPSPLNMGPSASAISA